MNEPQDRHEDIFVFQVARQDLAPLLEDLLRLEVEERSPLASAMRLMDQDGRAGLSAPLRGLADEPLVRQAVAILAAPRLVIDQRAAGSALPFTFLTACHAPQVDPEAFALIAPTEDGAVLVQLFDSPWLFLAWWLDLHASAVEEPTANYIPPPVSYESLVYLFHTIDLFRRKASESQLSYTPSDLSLPPDGFTITLKRAVQSRDLRWLLPAFLALMPRPEEIDFDDGPEPFEALARLGFLIRSEDGLLGFGEAGRAMGFEFDRTWFQATGFETAVQADGRWKTVTRAFLAPTALANHLVLEEPATAGEGARTLNHQAMTLGILETRLAGLLNEAVLLAGGAPSSLLPHETPDVATIDEQRVEGSVYCRRCGRELRAGESFCPSCGGGQTVFCHACGEELREGASFCASCGAAPRSTAT
jgi:hypothetical protein